MHVGDVGLLITHRVHNNDYNYRYQQTIQRTKVFDCCFFLFSSVCDVILYVMIGDNPHLKVPIKGL